MTLKVLRGLIALCLAAGAISHATSAQQFAPWEAAEMRASVLPTAFIANVGQWPADVRFAARFPDLDAFFEDSCVTLSLKARREEGTRAESVAQLRFDSAHVDCALVGVGRIATTYNFLRGRKPGAHVVGAPSFRSLRYQAVQPGINVEFVVRDGRLAFDVRLAPGADPSSLQFVFEADGDISRSAGGLRFETTTGTLNLSSPVAWEEPASSDRRAIAANFQVLDGRRWSFALENWDAHNPAVIDPGITWATYLGGSQSDQAKFLEAEVGGTVLVGGVTDSFNFPTTPGSHDVSLNNGTGIIEDVFLARLDASGSNLLAATFIGGSEADIPTDVAIGAQGHAIVVGVTGSTDFPVTPNAYDPVFDSTNGDGFVAILDPSLSQLDYATCIGAPGAMGVGLGAVAPLPSGELVIAAGTFSPLFVATPGAYDTTFEGQSDGIVLKLDPSLPPASQLIFASFLGGNDLEWGHTRLAIAPDGTIIVAGNTTSTDFPVTPGAFDTDFGIGFNSFIAGLSSDGSALQWATFVKGNGLDWIDLGPDGSVTACLGTSGTISPVTPGAFDTTPNGTQDAYVCRLDSTGSRLLWGTFLGGTHLNHAFGVDVDDSGAVMLCGRTSSGDFPTTPGAHDTTFSGACSDGFVSYLSSDGSQLLYSSFLGSGSSLCLEADVVTAVDVGVALVAGHAPGNFPVTAGAYDTTYGGGASGDGFVVKMPLISPWTDLGQGLAGTLGVPKLTGTGWLIAGEPTTLALARAKPSSTAALIVGLSQLSAPFKGGTLVPFPTFLITGLSTSPSGTLSLTASWPAGVPGGLTLYFQEWIVDPVAVAGLSASNALAAVTP